MIDHLSVTLMLDLKKHRTLTIIKKQGAPKISNIDSQQNVLLSQKRNRHKIKCNMH